MKHLIPIAIILAILITPDTLTYTADARTEPQLIEVPDNATPELMNKIYETAEEYGVEAEVMTQIIACESNFRNIQSRNRFADGTRERSFGLSQIYIDVHDVTRKQATDPEFAIEFLAKKLSENKGNLWSCYGQNTKSKTPASKKRLPY